MLPRLRTLNLVSKLQSSLSQWLGIASEDLRGVLPLLEQILAEGQAAWPKLEVAEDAVISFLCGHLNPEEDLESQIEKIIPADLYLASGCAAGDDAALSAFEEAYWSWLRQVLKGKGIVEGAADEALQRLRNHLFLPRTTRPAAIYAYNAQHSLKAWVRVVALRIGLMLLREQRPDFSYNDEYIGDALAPQEDPELAYLRQRCQGHFKVALSEVIAKLPDRDRTLLKQYYVHELTFSEMARIYNVDKSRPRRWVGRIRDHVREETRNVLRQRLRLTETQCDSLIRAAENELNLTLSRIF